MMLWALLSLSGCDAINKARDTIDGILDPVVVEGIVLGVEPPEDDGLSDLLSGSDYQTGTNVTLFMANAASVADIENAPITGATVTLDGVNIPEADGGLYALTPADETVPYVEGATWDLNIDTNDSLSSARVALPAPADFTDEIPSEHETNTPIELDFTNLGFDSVLLVVLDDNGAITYSNEPQTIREVYDFTHGNADLGLVTIPGEAFPEEAVYAVGVAGLVNTDEADLTEMNTALSSIVSGSMKLYPVSTLVIDVPL